jgi:EAL domain-containing protein (putative c-di-GMP-specific phosphodiesterase class I)
VATVLDRTGTRPGNLTLEMTEDIFIEDSARAGIVLDDLKRLGTHIALDDFGTGYSSLSYLRAFPVDVLKIDRSFLAIGENPDDALMLKGIADLAHALRLTVVAEGVETERQRTAVADAGCEYSQGFYYAIPMAADGIAQLLGHRSAHHTHLPLKLVSKG